MYKRTVSIIICLIAFLSVWGKGIAVNTITEEGAWCWFADPRALTFKSPNGSIHRTYIGYIDVHGNIKATQIDHRNNKVDEVLVRSYFLPDDHNNPTFLVLPDERVMIFYSRHTDEPCFYYRISQKPGDITTFGKEFRLETANNTTYPSPFILSDDPDHIYLCWRGIGWHPTVARLTMPDREGNTNFDWGPLQMVRSMKGQNGVRPYAKYVSNGKDKIFFAYTTTHPDNRTSNWLYCSYIDINTRELKDNQGNVLVKLSEDSLHDIDATPEYMEHHPANVVDYTAERDWLWEIRLDGKDNPVIAMARISADKTRHEYYYMRWTGSEWRKTFLAEAGGHFHQTPRYEMCYSAGMALDKVNPNIVYASVPVKGKFGNIYELVKFIISDSGEVIEKEQITRDSQKNNVRPFVISNQNDTPLLIWMNGDYYSWIVGKGESKGYPTAIRTNINLPQEKTNLEKGIILEKDFDNHAEKQTINFKKMNQFSIVMDVTLSPDNYFGNILTTNSFSYNLEKSEHSKPYFDINGKSYPSSNVLGSADSWKTMGRGTDGKWHAPAKFKTVQLVITYNNGVLRSYINGLADQYIEIKKLLLSDIILNNQAISVDNLKVFNRTLSQAEIEKLHRIVNPTEKDMVAYLMVYFKDDTHSLHFALSDDGYTFTALNNGDPIISGDTISEQKGVRDPYIMRASNGYFYMAMTDLHIYAKKEGLRTTEWERDGKEFGWGNNKGLVLMKSKDLIHWSHSSLRIDKAFLGWEDIGNAWAPELFYDTDKNKIMIYFSLRFKNGVSRILYSYMNDDFTALETEPQLMFMYPKYNRATIDGDITKIGNKYHMFYVVHEGGPAGIKQAVSDSLCSGYECDSQWYDPEPKSCEAPNVWKRIGEDKWVLMYDCYGITPHNFGFSETSDFKTFTNLGYFNEGVMKSTNFSSPKHGAVIHLTKKEAERLLKYWELKK